MIFTVVIIRLKLKHKEVDMAVSLYIIFVQVHCFDHWIIHSVVLFIFFFFFSLQYN